MVIKSDSEADSGNHLHQRSVNMLASIHPATNKSIMFTDSRHYRVFSQNRNCFLFGDAERTAAAAAAKHCSCKQLFRALVIKFNPAFILYSCFFTRGISTTWKLLAFCSRGMNTEVEPTGEERRELDIQTHS